MIPLNLQSFSKIDLNPNSRLLVKNNQLFLETEKPNIFTRLWRHFRHQYNNDRIVTQTNNLAKLLMDERLENQPNSLDITLRNINIIQTKLKGKADELDHLRQTLDGIKRQKIALTSRKWQKALPEEESLEDLKSEKVYDLIDCSLPDCLSNVSAIISMVNNNYVQANTKVNLEDLLTECGILTPEDCIERGIGPEIQDFTNYFEANKTELTNRLVSKGLIASK